MKSSKGLLMSTGLLGVLVIVLATWGIYKVIVPKTEVDKTVTTQEKQVTEKQGNVIYSLDEIPSLIKTIKNTK